MSLIKSKKGFANHGGHWCTEPTKLISDYVTLSTYAL